MLASGVLFQLEAMPSPIDTYLWWNPIAHPIAMMREAFYSGYHAPDISALYVMVVILATTTIGLITLHRFVRDALEN